MEAVKTHLQHILLHADLNTLSERNVREQMSDRFGWDASQLEEHKPIIKEGIETFLAGLQGGEDAGDPLASSQVVLGKRKPGADPGALPPTKSVKTTNASGEATFDLTDTRKVTVRAYNNKPYVDVREYYEKNGELLPGKKGILLTPQQWAAVQANAAAVAEALKSGGAEYSIVLGDMRHLRVRKVGEKLTVDIREFYDKDGTPAPGKKGITLQVPQWEALVRAAAEVDAALAALETTAPPGALAEVKAGSVHAIGAEQGSTGGAAQPSAGSAEGPSASGLVPQPGGNLPQGSNELPITLSSVRRADVSQFKGMTFVNIREYYEKDGEMRPGAKGISLSPDQFEILKEAAANISTALQAQDTGFRLALSSRRAVRISQFKGSTFVDIREMYEKDGEERPGKKGISLVQDQWIALVQGLTALQAALP